MSRKPSGELSNNKEIQQVTNRGSDGTKILVDILTPKQCLFFCKLCDRLEQKGHEVFRTTRRYREVVETLELKGADALVIGEHGGKELIDKLKASAQRIIEMSSLFQKLKPDASISFSSPEVARVSFGLKTPHICVNDSPHAEAVARLTIPLSERLFTPKMIPKKAWTKYGIAAKKVIHYNALDPWVWLKDFKPDSRILNTLGLTDSKPILTFRTEESFAAYLLNKVQKPTLIISLIKKILGERSDLQIVVVPRYEEQIKALKKLFKDRVVICESVIDGSSLLYYSSIFVGAGGTMTAEAALLGIPTFSCYPGKPYIIEKYLIRNKLVTREVNPKKAIRKILETLAVAKQTKEINSEIARRLVKTFEDPIADSVRNRENSLESIFIHQP